MAESARSGMFRTACGVVPTQNAHAYADSQNGFKPASTAQMKDATVGGLRQNPASAEFLTQMTNRYDHPGREMGAFSVSNGEEGC